MAETAAGSDVEAGNEDGRAVSVVGLLDAMAAATTVSATDASCVVGPTGVSVGCRGSSVAWARAGGNSFGIEGVAASLSAVTDEGLSGMDVGVNGASVCGSREVMRSADGVA